jgi:hypothetical protein
MSGRDVAESAIQTNLYRPVAQIDVLDVVAFEEACIADAGYFECVALG